MEEGLEATASKIRQRAEKEMLKHERWRNVDSVYYNGGTVLVLLCTALATYLASLSNQIPVWIVPTLTGLATFWVALDRALAFGPRWRFHVEMQNAYARVIDQVDNLGVFPGDEQREALKKINTELLNVRARESSIPGSGVDAK